MNAGSSTPRPPAEVDEVDQDAPTVTYRSEDFDRFPESVAGPVGEAAPSETETYRSYDHDRVAGDLGTVRDRAGTKPVTPADKNVTTK